MPTYATLPIDFLKFWYFTAPKEIILYFYSLNNAALQLLSLVLLTRTFFQPIKNEYRKGLIGFSVGLGMFVKTWIILVDLMVMTLLIFFEAVFLFFFIMCPLVTLWLLFI